MWVEGDIASGRSAWQGMAWCGCAGLLVSCSWGEIWMAASSWGEVGSAVLALEDVASWYVSYVASWYVSLVWVGLLGRLLGPLLGLWPFECGDFLAGFEASHLPFAIRPISRGRRTGASGVRVSGGGVALRGTWPTGAWVLLVAGVGLAWHRCWYGRRLPVLRVRAHQHRSTYGG